MLLVIVCITSLINIYLFEYWLYAVTYAYKNTVDNDLI